MIVGFHAPLPPLRTGVADYADVLLRALRERVQVNVDAPTADVRLYQLGNNQIHRAIYERAMAEPGVVVLHDAVLQHFYLGALEQADYLEEYVYNYGEWERPLAAELWRERAISGMDVRYFRRPMLRRVGVRSLAVIVHNPAAAEAVRRHAHQAHVVEIPHLFEPPPPFSLDDARTDVRARWGVGDDACVFGVFGYLRESKRVMPILECFERLHRERPRSKLLLAGAFASPDLAKAVEPFRTHPGILRMEYLGAAEFWRVAQAVDCCLNLRYPAAGETSGIGVRLMGLGKTVFFTEGREVERIPLNACVRVPPGLEESAALLEYMKMVVDVPLIAREIGLRAAAHVHEHHAVQRVAEQYWTTLCEAGASLR